MPVKQLSRSQAVVTKRPRSTSMEEMEESLRDRKHLR
eukprot:COSAG01_NODE_61657_length_288_cov_1.095238_1_plen_36_part_01